MRWKKGKQFLAVLFSRKIVMISAIVIAFFLLCAVASPLLATCDPYEQDLSHRLEGITAQHWLGTDQLGRDLYSRIVYGARVAFSVESWLSLWQPSWAVPSALFPVTLADGWIMC